MNLLDATLEPATTAAWSSSSAEFRLPVPAEVVAARPGLAPLRGPARSCSASGPRTWRTRRWCPTRPPTAGSPSTVELREALGSDVVVHFRDRRPAGDDRRRQGAGGRRRPRRPSSAVHQQAQAWRVDRRRPAQPTHPACDGRTDRARGRHPPPALLRPGRRVRHLPGDGRTAVDTSPNDPNEGENDMQFRRSRFTALAIAGLMAGRPRAAMTTTTGTRRRRPRTRTAAARRRRAAGGRGGHRHGEPPERRRARGGRRLPGDLRRAHQRRGRVQRSRSSRSGNFEEQFQIRAEGGTLDVAAVPQPGAIPALVDSGSIVSLEDLGFDIDELNATLGESFVALGEYEGEHYGLPDQHQPQEHGLVPEGRLRRRRLRGARDVGRARSP